MNTLFFLRSPHHVSFDAVAQQQAQTLSREFACQAHASQFKRNMNHALSTRLVVVTLVLWTWTAVGGAAAAAAVVDQEENGALCKLRLEGFGTKPGIKSAHLSCTGGSITAAAQPDLLKALGQTKGVVWDNECADVQAHGCMLVLCGGTATFNRPTITDMNGAGTGSETAVCVIGNSKLTLVDGNFARGSQMRPLVFNGDEVVVRFVNSSFTGNSILAGNLDGAALKLVWGAKASIHSCNFIGNKADNGGAISAMDTTQVDIMPRQGVTAGEV